MDALTANPARGDRIDVPAARIGLIIPSVNRLSEPQFTHFAPPGLGVHVTRARIAVSP
jgi:maleate cis-trans isomerase